jgi:hypothetical protein
MVIRGEAEGSARRDATGVPGITFRNTVSSGEDIFCRITRAHSSRSLIRLPPSCREKVRIICRVSPVFDKTESVRIWSRIAFSPAPTSCIVVRGISLGGRRFFALSIRITRLLVRIPSNGIDFT